MLDIADDKEGEVNHRRLQSRYAEMGSVENGKKFADDISRWQCWRLQRVVALALTGSTSGGRRIGFPQNADAS